MSRNKNHILAIIALFLSAASWGSGHAFVKSNLDAFSFQWLLALRLGMAALLMAIIAIPRWKNLTKPVVVSGFGMGFLMYGVYLFFALGVQYTTVSRAAFIVGAYIIFVPFIYIFVRKKLPKRVDIIATIVCLVGISIILLEGPTGGLNKGDALVVVNAFIYALHVVYSAKFAKGADVILLNMVQMGTCGIIAIIVALATSPMPTNVPLADFSGPMYLAIVATLLPYMLSLYGQKYVRTSTSAIILSFESVFGCLSSILLLGETISLRFVLGACVVMVSFFIITYGEKSAS